MIFTKQLTSVLQEDWMHPISQGTHYMEVGKELGHFYMIKSVGVSERGVFLVENPQTGEIEEMNDTMVS